MLTINLDEPRLMPFNPCLMGTPILVPNSSLRAFREVDYFTKGFFVQGVLGVLAWLGDHSRLVVYKRPCIFTSPSPRALRATGVCQGIDPSFVHFPSCVFLIKRRG
jgi:hypothetical protein